MPVDPSLRFTSYTARYKGSRTGWAENYKAYYCGRKGCLRRFFTRLAFTDEGENFRFSSIIALVHERFLAISKTAKGDVVNGTHCTSSPYCLSIDASNICGLTLPSSILDALDIQSSRPLHHIGAADNVGT